MSRTKNRALRPAVKREEHEDEYKLKKEILHGTHNTSKTSNKITKNRSLTQAHTTKVKSENDDDNKVILASSKKTFTSPNITAEKITTLIGYIVNDKMSVLAASKKAGLTYITALNYYHEYRDDPEHTIPLPKTRLYYPASKITQKKVADLIHYIVNDKMSVTLASKKVNMHQTTAKRYYLKYLHNPNREIPDPRDSMLYSGKPCTNDQVKSLIQYIVNDGMTLLEASVKAHMTQVTARGYYRQYLYYLENNIPTPEIYKDCGCGKKATFDQVKSFFSYIIIDRLSIAQASRKAKMERYSGQMYYNKYLKNFNIKDMSYSSGKMKRLVELVQDEKMSLRKAADAVELNINAAREQYHLYLTIRRYKFPVTRKEQYAQEDIRKLINYIEHDKMSLKSAAREINMDATFAYKYYKEYQNDPEHKIPVPVIGGHTQKNREFEKYTQIIADIYKNNPSIRPEYENHHSELDRSDIEIKKETVEEDKKILLNTEK